ncbi:MAG: extracellular solute-binding protein [Bacilli bacterium]|nr:extracellular solute-binding protein [Bacilli bacterium]
MKKQFLFALLLTGTMASCGGGSNDGRDKVIFWAAESTYNGEAVKQAVRAYNDGQGQSDGVRVSLVLKGRKYGDTESTSLEKSPTNVDIFGAYDDKTKTYVDKNLFTNLDELFANETLITKKSDGSKVLNLEDFSATNLNRFRVNKTTKWCGEGENLYALPQVADVSLLYYNEGFFKQNQINIISVPEDKLAAYNAEHGTAFAPHGYAEYSVAPAEGLVASESRGGTAVYKVFNNEISMNWDELEYLSKYFTKEWTATSPSKYGLLTEYWFPHGWSVGGDCMNLDPETGKYVFTLGSDLENYVAIDQVTIGEDTYKKGDIINYRSKVYVDDHKNDDSFAEVMSKLHVLPSQYDAFARFVSLTTKKGIKVDATTTGLGVSPTKDEITGGSKINYFTAGDTAMVIEGFEQVNLLNDAMTKQGKEFNVAKMYQYREYVGGSLDESGNLKVIGETYGGEVYTGELVKDNGVSIVGKSTTSSLNLGWSIPANSAHKESAFKFLQYWCSKDAQKILCAANDGAPTNEEFAGSEEYINQANKPFRSYDLISKYASDSDIGDWSYLENKDWVTLWSDDLNQKVRNGKQTLSAFFLENEDRVNNKLKTYSYKIHGKE